MENIDTKITADLVITNASQLLTCGKEAKDMVGLIENGWIAVKGEEIIAVGTKEEIDKAVDYKNAAAIDASGKVVVPGFVDSHTHLVYGGSRIQEYVARLTIDDIETIKSMEIKTGLAASMEMTREASEDMLFNAASIKLKRMLAAGTTTIEIKSGYGLDTYNEVKQLKVNRRLGEVIPVDVYSTFLGAHGWPQDMPKSKYIDLLIGEMIPAVSASGLASFCDVWCDDGYYTAEESGKILQAARDAGLEPKIHTDAYSYIGGSDLAADMKMVSADHLNFTPASVVKKLADSRIPGVLLPGTDFSLNHPRPFNPRPMIEQDMIIALATNCNPGNWTESMQFVMVLACRRHRMSPAKALRASTLGGATALNLEHDRGSLEKGKLADIQIWDTSIYEDVVYRLGGNIVDKVIKRGKVVVDNSIIKEGHDVVQ